MPQVKDFTIDSIIKNYQNRQEKISYQMQEQMNDYADTSRYKQQYLLHQKSGASTPEFSNNPTIGMLTKKSADLRENPIQRTQKKNENYHTFNPHQIISSPFCQDTEEYYKLLQHLDETEQKLIRADRSYTEIWRKYQKLQAQQKKSSKKQSESIRNTIDEVNQLKKTNEYMHKQIQNYKYAISSKESSICILRDQLKQKNERLVASNNKIEQLKAQLQALKTKQQNIAAETSRKQQKQLLIDKIQQQLSTFEAIIAQKQIDKKNLLKQLENSYLSHKQEMEIVKAGYCKVQEEYKQWIDQCNHQKNQLIADYELKLKQISSSSHYKNGKFISQQKHQDQINKKDEEINRLIFLTVKQTNTIKQLKSQCEKIQKSRNQTILKISAIENIMVIKNQSLQSLQSKNMKLTDQLQQQQLKTSQLTQKYNVINKQFIELKNKCHVMFSQIQQHKSSKNTEGKQIIRLRKDLLSCHQQLQKYKNNQYDINKKLTQAINAMKLKLNKAQQQRQQINTDLMAERFENVKLKQQIKQTKQYLKKQYQLSIKNTRKQLQNQIRQANSDRRHSVNISAPYDVEKQQLYLQFRQLQRKYELLASQIVTVDQVMSMAVKVQKRHQSFKK